MRVGDCLIQMWRFQVAARWIPRGSRVLDIGCFQGELFTKLGEKIAPSIGLDPQLVHETVSGRNLLLPIAFPETQSFPEQSFDVIVLLATIEHIRNKSAVAKEAWRLLQPGGRIILTVPSAEVDKILPILIRVHLVDGMSLDEHHGFVPNELLSIFQPEGFRLLVRRRFQFGLNNLFVLERV